MATSRKKRTNTKATGSSAADASLVTATGNSQPTRKEANLQALLKGLQGGSLGSAPLLLSTGAMTTADVISQLEPVLEKMAVVKPAYAAWRSAVAAQKAAEQPVAPMLKALRVYLRARIGAGNVALANFGLSSRAPKKRTATVVAAATATGKATRAAKKAALATVSKPAATEATATAPAMAAHPVTTGSA